VSRQLPRLVYNDVVIEDYPILRGWSRHRLDSIRTEPIKDMETAGSSKLQHSGVICNTLYSQKKWEAQLNFNSRSWQLETKDCCLDAVFQGIYECFHVYSYSLYCHFGSHKEVIKLCDKMRLECNCAENFLQNVAQLDNESAVLVQFLYTKGYFHCYWIGRSEDGVYWFRIGSHYAYRLYRS